MADFTVNLELQCNCATCGAERQFPGARDARVIAHGKRTWFVEHPEPCPSCGERRTRVAYQLTTNDTKGTDPVPREGPPF